MHNLRADNTSDSPVRPITMAVTALGGQGGGVFSNWVLRAAEREGYIGQSTSVPGVAQRTGATVYYLEFFPRAEVDKAGREPVMALTPAPGDVDIVVASELAESARAVLRGIVTPDRTTLIVSTHRIYAIGEKSAAGDGAVDSAVILEKSKRTAKRVVNFDMQKVADECGGLISSVMLGAVAGSGALPFTRKSFEQSIREGGVAIDANLAGFVKGFEAAQNRPRSTSAHSAKKEQDASRAKAKSPAGQKLLDRVIAEFPTVCHSRVIEGARRLVDYQSPAYADLYLNRLTRILALDSAAHEHELTNAVAVHLALWMSYEDSIRVADLKTRASRVDRVREDIRAEPNQLIYTVEYMHPRIEEFCDTLPWFIGGVILNTPWLRRALGVFFRKGRRFSTAKLSGFLPLYLLTALRRTRRISYRYRQENARMESWLALIADIAPQEYALAVETAKCQRLIKGYGDTHERGLRNFSVIMQAINSMRGRQMAAAAVRALRDAALADDNGEMLSAEIAKIA